MTRAMIVALGVLAAWPAAAEERRELGAHEHGHSVLNIAIEGSRVEMELIAPGMDIVGFEHAAESEEQKATIEQAETTLGDPLALFVLPAGAGCRAETVAIELEVEGHHEQDDADEHEHAEDADHEDEAGHNQFHAVYGIACSSPGNLGSIGFAFFERFPGAQEIDVTVITENGQTRYEVERDAPRIDLKGLI